MAVRSLESSRGSPVTAHVADVVHSLEPNDIADVCERTHHALGEVRRADAERVVDIRDWHPDFAFSHIFHIVTEKRGTIPTWQELKATRGKLDEMLWQPERLAIDQAVERTAANRECGGGSAAADSRFHETARHLARGAMTWRVGNAYYSFLREMYVLSVLRSEGIDARSTHWPTLFSGPTCGLATT